VTEDLYIVQKEEWAIRTFDERSSIFTRDKPIISSERMLRRNYVCKGSVGKSLWSCQGVLRQDELTGGKPLVLVVK
jgi:hypothetical protein